MLICTAQGVVYLVNNQQISFDPPSSRRRSALLALILALFALVAFSQPPGNFLTTAQKIENTYEEEIENGRDLLRRRRWEDALKSFKRANELKGKTCGVCFYLMGQAYMGLEAYKNVVQSSDNALQFAGSDTELQAQAHNLKGIALQKQSDTKDQKKLQDAEAAFRQSAALKADYAEVYYNLGVTLLQQNRDPEGIAELKKYLEMGETETTLEEARKMIDNPRRAREPYAPDFSVTTADGEYISLDDLHGKVVLLDFWGTWCPPCVASVPALRDLNKKYGKGSAFVMIGISSDGDEDKWRAFTAKEKMVWPQYLDRDRRVQRAFKVSAFPTYIVLDAEGVIRYRSLGASFEKETALSDAINKQVKLASKTAPSK
jgi:peroxiredoxin